MMDMHNFTEAKELIDKFLHIKSAMAGVHRSLIICDRIYCELIGENNRELISTLLDDKQKAFMKQMKNFISIIRTEYIVALIFEKDNKKAEKTNRRFKKCCQSHPYKVDVESEEELIQIAEKCVNL